MITDKELVYLSVLLRLKMKTLKNTEVDNWKRHNYRVIMKFISEIKERKIDDYIEKLKDELKDSDLLKHK
jgi:hypothetical protein